MQALRTLSDEHQSLAGILHAVRFMLKEITVGRLTPDLKLLQAMVHYLDAYAEQRHHPKEDRLFRYLASRTQEGAEALAQLADQHGAAPLRIAALEQALNQYVAHPTDITAFAQAFYTYADFYRSHMLLEEDVVLPLCQRHLSAEDWTAIDQEFLDDSTTNPVGDGAAENFTALFSRLVASAPAPVGLGPRPYTDA